MTNPQSTVTPPTGIPVTSELVEQVWFTTREAAAYTRRHTETVLKAAAAWPAAGALQSTQAGRKGHRRYRREWLDAWTDQS